MKKRIVALVMCALVAVSSVPVTPVAELFRVEATAVDIETLDRVYKSAPAEETWGDYINISSMKGFYNYAAAILKSPSTYTQEEIDECAADLQAAIEGLQPYATGIDLNKTSLELEVGKSEALIPALAPEKAGGTVTWSSSDSEHVSVSATGMVSVLGYTASPVEIQASVSGKDGRVYSASCFVKTENPVAGVTLSTKNLILYTSATKILSATLAGLDTTAKPTGTAFYTWDSSNTSVATVDDQGKVIAVGEGSCTITLTVSDGKGRRFSDTCSVTVNRLTPVESLRPSGSNKIVMTSGASEKVQIFVLPENASIKTLNWSTSARDIVAITEITVSDSGIASAKLTAGKEGTAKITYATTDGSEISGTIDVEVRPLISELKLSAASKSITLDSQNEKIGVTIIPSNAGNQVLNWFSTDDSVCAVDYNGVLYPKSTGECNIKVSTTDGSDIVATCRVVVSAKAKEVKIDRATAQLENGERTTLFATVTTTDGETHDAVSWSSSNPDVAEVDQNGVVTAKYPGQTAIKATAVDGTNLYDICTVTVTQKITGITLPESVKVAIGTTKVLAPTFTPSYATETKLSWSSNNPAVATVSSDGVVTAISVGSATITCKSGSAVATCKIEVIVPATGITLSSSSEELWTGDVVLLKATVAPQNATDKTVTWSTSNDKVATVTADGLVTAVAGGSCFITAKNSAGNTASCRIEVFESCTGVEISAKIKSMYIGQTDRLTATVVPATATNKQINWSSSSPEIATVDSSTGEIKALKTGSTVITATTADGGFTASCTVTVHSKVSVERIALDANSMKVDVGVIHQLMAMITPSNASEQGLVWSSNNTSVVIVNQKGQFKGLKAGTAVITAKTVDGGYTAQCKITVVQPVTGIRITTTDVKLAVGKSKALSWNIFPDDATNKKVNWDSSDTSVATVDQNGVVMAKKSGITVITATTDDGGYTSTCNFTVYVPVTGVEVNASSIKVPKGQTRLLSAIIKPSNATDKTVSWVSSNTSIVKVNEAGQVTGVAKGSATVTCKTADGAFKASCTVTVVQLVEKITIDATSVTLQAGKSKTLTAKVSPSTATYTTVKWSSSNTKVATVSSTGVVKAVAGGSAVITAKSLDGNATATCKINVTQPASGVTVTSPSKYVRIGKIVALKATVTPSTATNKNVTWSSSDTKRATVTADGVVKGISQGYVTISAKTASGGHIGSYKILVVKSVTGIKLDKTSITINVGKATTITPVISPSDATIKTVKWTSDNNDVATVDSTGKVTAKAQGHATITAKTTDGSFTATSSVLVIKPVTSVTLNKTSAYLNLGASMSLVAKILPADATIQSVTWTSSNPSVATVSSTGLVKGLKKGTATITCRTNNGGKTATCTIAVVKRVTGISLNKSDEILYLGKTLSLVSTVYPVDASVKTVTYHSSNKSIATVSSSGVVTPLNLGTVNITAVTSDGSYKATCKVTVKKAPESIKLGATSATFNVGQVRTLKYVIYPTDATNRVATFTSSNTAVATVDASGRITAVSRGTANITAMTENGIKAVCKITVNQPVTGIEIDPTAEVYTGEKVTPYVSILPKNANNQSITWKTSDSSIAKVSSTGEVTGIKAGKVTITAVSQENTNFTASCELTVKQHVTSVSFNEKEVFINKGAEADLEYTVYPADATDKGVTFESSDPTVVTVTNEGHITARLGGKAEITVISKDGGFKGTCYVNVVEPATGVSLNYSKKDVFVTDTLQLIATVSPSDAYNKLVKWSSDNAEIASVDSEGVVTALKSGNATITATTVDGGYIATCELTLLQRATAIVTDRPEVKINRGTTCQLNAEVLPEDCYNKAFRWTSDDESIATVTEDGFVEGIAPGVVTLTCTSLESGIFVTVQLTVHEPVTDFNLVEEAEELYTPLTKKLSTEFLPLNASDKSITWESSDESVATVSEDGTVTAVGKGEVTITATSNDSGISDSCSFTIYTGVEEIITGKDAYSFHENTTMKLDYGFNPESVDDPRVKFESSDENVFTVSDDGTLTGIVLGQAELTITSLQNEDVSKTVTINITRAVTDISLDITEKVLYTGDELKLTETVLPADASDKSVIWSSSNEDAVTVDENGNVTAVARGFATVTATTVDGELEASCEIEVIQLPEEIASSKDKYVVFMGQPLTLDFEVLPADTNDKTLIWSSSDEDIALVDAEGTVIPVSTGKCEVTAESIVDGVERTVEIIVIQLAEEIKFFCRVEDLEIGGKLRLFATILPETTTDKSFVWSSSDESIATVDKYGVVTAVSSGTVQIIATSLDEGGVSSSIKVTVK